MTVSEAIDLLALDPQLEPLRKFLSAGEGYLLDEFCSNAKFQPPKLNHESLLRLVRSHLSYSKAGEDLGSPLWTRVSKATAPVLSSVISDLGGTPGGRLADRKAQLKHYLINHEFPVVIAKKKRVAKKASSTINIDIDALVAEYEGLKERSRTMTIDDVDSSFTKIFNRKGCTVSVLKGVLKRQNLDTSGTKKKLLDRLQRIPRTLASGHALESFS